MIILTERPQISLIEFAASTKVGMTDKSIGGAPKVVETEVNFPLPLPTVAVGTPTEML